MTSDNILTMDSRTVFVKAVQDSIKNIIFFGLGAVFIAVVWRFSWWAGAVLFVGYVIVVVLSAVMELLLGGLGLFTIPGAVINAIRGNSSRLREEGYLTLAYLFRFVESALLIGAGVYLYLTFWHDA